MIQEVELKEVFDYAESIYVYNSGRVCAVNSEEELFNEILIQWKHMIEGAHLMPAFGVSINELTIAEKKKGLWIEFDFNKAYESDGMPYEKLLISVQSMNSGFNLIRYTSECGYDGRCFYFDLVNENMSNLYNKLNNL